MDVTANSAPKLDRDEGSSDVLDEITQLYFRAAARPARTRRGRGSGTDALRLRLRAAELAAGIDAWTGGWFSRALREPAS